MKLIVIVATLTPDSYSVERSEYDAVEFKDCYVFDNGRQKIEKTWLGVPVRYSGSWITGIASMRVPSVIYSICCLSDDAYDAQQKAHREIVNDMTNFYGSVTRMMVQLNRGPNANTILG